jgi:hypothetical protein
MSGIYPSNGRTESQDPSLGYYPDSPAPVSGCVPKYYPTNQCSPRIDPASLNAIISNLACAIESAGIAYNCADPCQLSAAMIKLANNKLWKTVNASAGTLVMDLDKYYGYTVIMDGNLTLGAPVGAVTIAAGQRAMALLNLVQDATGGRTVTWNAAFHQIGGTAPTLSTAGGAHDNVPILLYDASRSDVGPLSKTP